MLEYIHRGEAETIALAVEVYDSIVILDDKRARSIARRLGLKVIGTVGVLILAKKQGLIDVKAEIRKLLETSFHLSQNVVTKAVKEAERDC